MRLVIKPLRHSLRWVSEAVARLSLIVLFLYLETRRPFQRVIHKEELWLYQNPMTGSYVPTTVLWWIIVVPLPLLPILYNLLNHRRSGLGQPLPKADLAASILASTLLLPLNGIVTDLIKLSVGRPRPDFAFRCWPKTGFPPSEFEDVIFSTFRQQDLHCSGNLATIIEGRKSFPSGHSSFSFASFGFLFFYLSAKLKTFSRSQSTQNANRDANWIFRFIFSLSLVIIPMTLAISRTCDYHHHWQDVTMGSFLGLSLAFTVYRQYYPSIFSEDCDIPLQFSNLNTESCKDRSNISYTDVESPLK